MYNLMLKGKIIEVFGSQWKFAHHLGIHESEISKVINQRKKLSTEKKKEWAKALNSEPGEIFNNG